MAAPAPGAAVLPAPLSAGGPGSPAASPAVITVTGLAKGQGGRGRATVAVPQPAAAGAGALPSSSGSGVTVVVRQPGGGPRSVTSSRASSGAPASRGGAAAATGAGTGVVASRHHSTATLFPGSRATDGEGEASDATVGVSTPQARKAHAAGGARPPSADHPGASGASPRSGGSPGAASTTTSMGPRLLSGRLASSAAGSVTGPLVRSLEAGGLGGATVLTPSRQRSTAPVRVANHRRILNALGLVFFAGPANADKLKTLRRVVEDVADRQLLLALASTGTRSNGTLVGIYAVVEAEPEAAEAVRAGGRVAAGVPSKHVLARRVWGASCPPILLPPMVRTLLKFDTAARSFREVGFSVTLTVTTDAVGIDTAFLSPTAAATAAAASTAPASGAGGGAASARTSP
jgi:hypothetical protein